MKQPIFVQSGSPIKRFKVFGERCSGTNLTEAVIDANFPELLRVGNRPLPMKGYLSGWKHGFPSMVSCPSDLLAVVVVRHPQTWLQSLHAKPWHVDRSLRRLPISRFIREEWRCVVDQKNYFGVENDDGWHDTELMWERHPITGKPFDNVMKLRNLKNECFLNFGNRFENLVIVRCEDVTSDKEFLLRCIENHFGLKYLGDVQPYGVIKGKRDEQYVEKKYESLTGEDINFIWSELDHQIERRLGYLPPDELAPIAS